MVDDPENGEDELLLTEQVEPETPQEQAPEQEEQPEAEDEEEILTFGDEGEPVEAKGDTNLVKHLREQIKKRDKDLAEARKAKPDPEPIEVGPKPTLADFDFDEEARDAAYDEWFKRKEAADRQQGEASQSVEREREAWTAELQRVDSEKAEIKAPDIDDAFDTVRSVLSLEQQAALVQATDKGNTARIIYALGKHPDKLAELGDMAITDMPSLARFIKSVSKLEAQLKVVKRRVAPQPEQVERGSGPVAARSDKKLEKLEKEADKTGDRTELLKYRKQLQAKR
jgi:hypothetical protein